MCMCVCMFVCMCVCERMHLWVGGWRSVAVCNLGNCWHSVFVVCCLLLCFINNYITCDVHKSQAICGPYMAIVSRWK